MDSGKSDGSPPLVVAPLTRRGKGGKLYKRPPAVEKQILEVMILEPDQVLERAQVPRGSPGYLREEVLVFMFQQYQQTGQAEAWNDMAQQLLKRCSAWLKKKLKNDKGIAPQVAGDVIEQTFTLMMETENRVADILQVSFLTYLSRRYKDAKKKEIRKLSPLRELVEPDGFDKDDKSSNFLKVSYTDILTIENHVVLRESLVAIRDQSHRDVYMLRHAFGMPIESKDPEKMTLAKLFDKSGRMIRYMLANAQSDIAAADKGDKNE